MALPGLVIVETASGWTAATLHPWNIPINSKEYKRTFGHNLTIASLLRRDGSLILEAHTEQQDELPGGEVAAPYPCVPSFCPAVIQRDGAVRTKRFGDGFLQEENPDAFWRTFLDENSFFAQPVGRLRSGGNSKHDVFLRKNRDVHFLAAGIATRHKLTSPSAREAFELLRAGRLELPTQPTPPPAIGQGRRAITS